MASSVLVTATQRRSGKSMITLGLVSVLERSLGRVGYFKPIGQRGPEGVDPDVKLMKEVFGLEASYEEMTPVYMDEVTDAIAHGKYDAVLDRILDAYQALQEKKDFVVCEGTDYFGAMAAFEFNINADLSKNLSAPIVLVANASNVELHGNGNGDQSPCESKAEAVLNNIGLVKESIDEKSAELFGVVINAVSPDEINCIEARATHDFTEHGIRLLGTVPKTDLLERPYLDEIARAIDAEVISGEGRLDVVARDVIVAAMSLEYVLRHLKRGSLVVVPGDREDVLLGMACAYHSPAVPSPAGLVMTGGIEPREHVKKLFLEVTGGRMPVLSVKVDTYQATIKVNDARPQLRSGDRARIETVKSLVENNVEVDSMLARGAAPTKLHAA
jgi:phosphate acetyltransferase